MSLVFIIIFIFVCLFNLTYDESPKINMYSWFKSVSCLKMKSNQSMWISRCCIKSLNREKLENLRYEFHASRSDTVKQIRTLLQMNRLFWKKHTSNFQRNMCFVKDILLRDSWKYFRKEHSWFDYILNFGNYEKILKKKKEIHILGIYASSSPQKNM